jgi:hypothetical protein
MKPRTDTYNWKEIINKLSKNSDKNMEIGIEAIILLLIDFPIYAK